MKVYIYLKCRASEPWTLGSKIKAEVPLGLPLGFYPSLPYAPAILGFPTLSLADFSEVLGNSSAVLLGLVVADFVEVHHSFFLLFFCILIIAHIYLFVKLFFKKNNRPSLGRLC